MSNSNQIKKVPPFLELSGETINRLDTTGLDLEDVISVWTGLTKCSTYVKSGKRLENISWRIVNRNLIREKNHVSNIPRNNTTKPIHNKLNDGDFASLLSIVTNQNEISQSNPFYQRPHIMKKRSSNKNVNLKSSRNKSVESFEKRPPISRKSSSSRSLKRSSIKRKSNIDLSTLNASVEEMGINDSDLYEQPHPKYAFGINDALLSKSLKKDEVLEESQVKPLERSDTSTSIVRGFSPNHISVSQHSINNNNETPKQSLFSNNHQKILNPQPNRPSLPTPNSLFNNTHHQHQHQHQHSQTVSQQVPPQYHHKAKSPLIQESVLEHPSRKKSPSLFTHSEINVSKTSSLDQTIRSPKSKPRRSVLNNLGMTKLEKDAVSGKSNDMNKKNMFFIESSPSPTDVSNRYIDDLTEDQQVAKEVPKRDGEVANNQSLFAGKSRHLRSEILFTSDDSISDGSDWSSVSESEGSDDYDDHEINRQWNETIFRRDKPLPKPHVTRSLLSGLFLNDMQQNHKDQIATQISSRGHADSRILKSEAVVGELGTSLASNNIVIKHRHKQHSDGDEDISNEPALEISTTEPQTAAISTSHVNAMGLLNEPLNIDTETGLKEKLEQPPNSLGQLISKSAMNLTNYFAMHRKNSFSSIASDRARQNFRQESRAPPTASTLLPTALSTHMFLPNAHQRAKSKLVAVQENESTDTSRKNSEGNSIAVIEEGNPIKSPSSIAIVKRKIQKDLDNSNSLKDQDQFNISRKLSPKTTRRQMLATELSDSLRKSILWDRKNGIYPQKSIEKEQPTNDNEENNENTSRFSNSQHPKILKAPPIDANDNWDTNETDFHTKGW